MKQCLDAVGASWHHAGNFFERAAAPLKRILERNNLKPADLDAVELLGGGTRVPKLQVRRAASVPGITERMQAACMCKAPCASAARCTCT
jgi:hypothetical protein